MSWQQDPSLEPDESFGPGTDLVISLFAVLLLILVLALRVLSVSEVKSIEPEHQPKNLWTLQQRYPEEPLFEQDKAVLTAHTMKQLDLILPTIRSALDGESCNQLLVEGYASPEAPAGLPRRERERWNLELSVNRSMAVVDYLHDHNIPYECISVTGFGRSHSPTLGEWLGSDSFRSVADWDEHWGAQRDIDDVILARERIVKIFGIQHENSLCGLALGQPESGLNRFPG